MIEISGRRFILSSLIEEDHPQFSVVFSQWIIERPARTVHSLQHSGPLGNFCEFYPTPPTLVR